MSIQIQTVTSGSCSMDYFHFGNGPKTLVILPGLSVQSVMKSAAAVAHAYQMFTEDFTVYVFDRRNDLPQSYPINEMANDTYAVMRQLGLQQINLFGASQGGMIALSIAARHPSFVEKLIVGSSSPACSASQYQIVESWVRLAQNGQADALLLSFGAAVYPSEMFQKLRPLVLETAKTVTDEELRRFRILAEGIRSFDITKKLNQIQCPVLAISAKDDGVFGPNAALFMEQCFSNHSSFSSFVYDGYGHAAYDTAPDYRARMLRFLMGPSA